MPSNAYVAQSERLWLQDLTVEDHLDDMFRLESNPESMFWSTKIAHKSPAESAAHIQSCYPTPEEPWKKSYAIVLRPKSTDSEKKSLTMVGVIGTPREAEIGYKIHPDYWGKGYMTEALQLFLEMWWNNEDNCEHRIISAHTDVKNIPSQRVLEKVGFRRGHVLRQHYVRGIRRETGERGDLQSFYLARVGAAPGFLDDYISTVSIPEISQADAAQIRDVLAKDGIDRQNKAL